MVGGGRATWTVTRKKIKMPNGDVKTLYRNSVTGEQRIRKMVKRVRRGVTVTVATYVRVGQ
jgi:hypothetical protein